MAFGSAEGSDIWENSLPTTYPLLPTKNLLPTIPSSFIKRLRQGLLSEKGFALRPTHFIL